MPAELTAFFVDLGIVFLALGGLVLLALHVLNQHLGTGASTLYTPIAMLFSSATASAMRGKVPALRARYREREDRKILISGIIIVIATSLITALFTIGAMADKHRQYVNAELDQDRNTLSTAFAAAIRQQISTLQDPGLQHDAAQ